MYKKKILIDLDGVLNEYNGEYNEIVLPKIKDGAKDFLEKLYKTSDLYLFTTRNLMLAVKWLMENNLDRYFKDVTNIKIPSYLYIDDRCICFKGKYNEMLKDINNFQAYWKRQ